MFLRSHAAICAATLLAVACAPGSRGPSAIAAADSSRIRADVSYLASDALEGRGTGTAGNDSAAAFIARRYATLGLQALSPGYLQPFDVRSAVLAHSGGATGAGTRTQNVMALLRGADAALRGQVIVVGGHSTTWAAARSVRSTPRPATRSGMGRTTTRPAPPPCWSSRGSSHCTLRGARSCSRTSAARSSGCSAPSISSSMRRCLSTAWSPC